MKDMAIFFAWLSVACTLAQAGFLLALNRLFPRRYGDPTVRLLEGFYSGATVGTFAGAVLAALFMLGAFVAAL